MPIINLLSSDLVIHNLEGGSKKRTIEQISNIISDCTDTATQDAIFSGLIERERLGSTGIGEGVAIPHCRLDELTNPVALFIKLREPIDFDAIDREPVDLVFALVVPGDSCDQHLNTLAELAELFSKKDNRDALRQCQDSQSLYRQLASLSS
ncbi:MAG: PTS IIA-like nitrogen regulatory protein PtsN [Pseudomonadales bacterium]|nr:PTS IIA-like nitrogen regulatory protein PtsN [Pseudomonadales bacterium]NRA18675.1 PTS IIA-like nitrogen regulatory protein PtsN [Oceanospirillaceae bacterium]